MAAGTAYRMAAYSHPTAPSHKTLQVPRRPPLLHLGGRCFQHGSWFSEASPLQKPVPFSRVLWKWRAVPRRVDAHKAAGGAYHKTRAPRHLHSPILKHFHAARSAACSHAKTQGGRRCDHCRRGEGRYSKSSRRKPRAPRYPDDCDIASHAGEGGRGWMVRVRSSDGANGCNSRGIVRRYTHRARTSGRCGLPKTLSVSPLRRR